MNMSTTVTESVNGIPVEVCKLYFYGSCAPKGVNGWSCGVTGLESTTEGNLIDGRIRAGDQSGRGEEGSCDEESARGSVEADLDVGWLQGGDLSVP